MKNRNKLKKLLTILIFLSLIFISLLTIINVRLYNEYSYNYNVKINRIISNVHDKYDIDMNDIINDINDNNYLKGYGIDIDNKSILEKNNKLFSISIFTNIVLVLAFVLLVILIIFKYDNKKTKEINDITKYIEELNKKNYSLYIDDISEDELSILKNEIYKTTVLLKEDAINSKKDKIELKKSLEDISHQLKTPLTSILILLDNLLENPEMDKKIREDFIRDIKREINNINFLVQSILKLSRFDTNSVNFIVADVNVKDLIEECIKNVSLLAEVKNVNIKLNINKDFSIKCDRRWQVEAITNIIKNCVEHTNDMVVIDIDDNNVYSSIVIRDNGKGISKKDLKNIFKRFYRGENAKADSIGIGLSLAKSIIEKDNGNISVESSCSGSVFCIKYYK